MLLVSMVRELERHSLRGYCVLLLETVFYFFPSREMVMCLLLIQQSPSLRKEVMNKMQSLTFLLLRYKSIETIYVM